MTDAVDGKSDAPAKRVRARGSRALADSSGVASERHVGVKPLPGNAFQNAQLSLFQFFLPTTDSPSDALSNAVELWDSVPRFSVSRARMNAMRLPGGFLPVLDLAFRFRGRDLRALIRPAQIVCSDGEQRSYYPSAREELIELALRKISTEQSVGFFDSQSSRSGAKFSLHHLRRELEACGHSLRYDEIIEGLDILSLASVEIHSVEPSGDFAFARSMYLPAMTGVRRQEYENDRSARWVVQFHPLITRSIERATHRQFNYRRLMSCSTQLSRWLLSLLVIKYTQAAFTELFEVRYSTIQRDSALLNGYTRARAAVRAVSEAWDELKVKGAVAVVERREQRGARGKLEDILYVITPTRAFVQEQKAANRRTSDAQTIGSLPRT